MDQYGNVKEVFVKYIRDEDANVPYSKELLDIINLMLV